MFDPPWLVISASATPEASTRWRMTSIACAMASIGHGLAACGDRLQDDLGAALEVEGELRGQARVGPAVARQQRADELGEQVVGEVEVADLGRGDRLTARRQRRVAHGDRVVVVEVAELLLGGERVAEQVGRIDQVGLLDDLFAVEVVVRIVQQQRVATDRGLEIPSPEQREGLALLMHPQCLVTLGIVRRRHVYPL